MLAKADMKSQLPTCRTAVWKLEQLPTHIPLNQLPHFVLRKARAEQCVQFAEGGFAGHAAAGQHADLAQAAARFVDIQFDATFVALSNGDDADAAVTGALQAFQKGRVVAGAGAAAEAFEDQTLNAAVDQTVQLGGADAGEQRQDRDVRHVLRLAIIQ